MKALVVFHGDTEEGVDGSSTHPLGFLLRRGFRHCFACLLSNGLWLRVDGQCGVPVFAYVTADDFDLAGFYREKGLTVVETEQRSKPLWAPFVMTNCVGLVKAALCIRAPFALTPYRLYRHLLKERPCN